MKVLVVSHMYPSTFNNMAGIFVHKQVKALIDKGCEVKVVSPVPYAPTFLGKIKPKWREYGKIPVHDNLEGVDVYYPRYIDFPKSLFMGYSGHFMYQGMKKVIDDIYKSWQFDIIHSHVALPDGFASTILNKTYGVPLVLTIHGQDLQVTVNKGSLCKKNVYRAMRDADRVVVVSSKLKGMIEDKGLMEASAIIHNGVELCEEHETSLNQNLDKKIRILSVSNLYKFKGIDLNLHAVSRIIKKYPNIEYKIIGDGPDKARLVELTDSLGLKGYVEFLGRMSHENAMCHMAKCDIFCLPSYQEGFGVAYLEAMSLGKPVIGVSGQGIQDAIVNGENGMLVKPQNIDDIVNALEYLLSNPEKRYEMGRRARLDIINEWTWDKNALKTLEVYKQLLN